MEFQTREEVYSHLHENQMVGQADKDVESARRILGALKPPLGSVLDVGCGRGAWMKAAQELGATDTHGVEGPWLNRDGLLVDSDKVEIIDLEKGSFELGRLFNTVVCIEVGEHLPESAADALVESLVRHGDRIVFSAAVPGQGGHGHINEQWQGYWAAKFEKHGYGRRDPLRDWIWEDPEIHYYLRQNVMLFQWGWGSCESPASVVHPEMWTTLFSRYSEIMNTLNDAGWVQTGVGPTGLMEIKIMVPERHR